MSVATSTRTLLLSVLVCGCAPSTQTARGQGLCLEPATFGEDRVAAWIRQFDAAGMHRNSIVEAGILEDSGKTVVCWDPAQ